MGTLTACMLQLNRSTDFPAKGYPFTTAQFVNGVWVFNSVKYQTHKL